MKNIMIESSLFSGKIYDDDLSLIYFTSKGIFLGG